MGVGVLYSPTTISGPPLARHLNNQGFVRHDFKAVLAFYARERIYSHVRRVRGIRLLTREPASLVPALASGIVINLPFGHHVIRKVEPRPSAASA